MALRLRRGTNLQRLDFTPEQGELIYVTDYDTASVSPLWIGDGTTVGGVEVSSSGGGGITDVSSDTTPELGGNLSLAGFEINGTGDIDITGDITAVGNVYANNIVGDLTGAVTGNVSGNVTGNLTGNAAGNHTGFFTGEINATGAFDGDITGSVFADDSTLLIDGVGNLVKGAFLNNAIDLQEGAFKINYPTTGSDPYVDIQVIGNNNKRVDTTFVRKLVGGNIGDSDLLYQEVIVRDDDIGFQREWTTFVNSNAYIINKGNTYSPANSVAILDGQVGIGTFAPNAELEVNGSIIATSGILGDLKGSVAADDSTILVDSVSGSINIANTNIGAFNVTSPQAGQVLKWNGSEWTNAADNSGGGGAGGSAFTNIGIGADDSVLRLIEEGESFLILGGAGISTASDTEGNITITGFDGAFSSLTGKPTTIAGYGITDAFDGDYNSLTNQPTIPSAYTNSDVDAHLNQSNPTSGYVLSWNGTDYAWVAQSGGITNTDSLAEGSTNLYYTDARFDARLQTRNIGNLADVDTTGASDGQALAWSSSNSQWEPLSLGSTFGLAGNTGTHTFNGATETLTFLGTTGQINAGIAANNVTLELDADLTGLTTINTHTIPSGTGTLALTSDISSTITGSDLDMGGNKVLFANVYSAEGDLPSASTYHGMFAHVHGTGKGYFAHAGSWVALANEADQTVNTTDNVTFNDVTVDGTLTASDLTLTGSGAITLTSGSTLALNATDEVTTNAPFRLVNLTSAEITALTAQPGMVVYNTTTNKAQCYNGSGWQDMF